MEIGINGKYYLLTRDCFADIIEVDSVELKGFSEDITAFLLFFTEPFLAGLIKNKPPFPFAYVMERKENPLLLLDTSNSLTLSGKFEYLEALFRDDRHHFQAEMLKCALWMLFLDIANIFLHQAEEKDNENTDTERRRMLFMQFMKLLHTHIREQHTVDYYASRLCITPQYLNRVVRHISGQTISGWIGKVLTGEIARQLENTASSVQQIAETLNFPDQATLTKFFKRQTGTSPTDYRKKNRL